jgi:hypothetical protein
MTIIGEPSRPDDLVAESSEPGPVAEPEPEPEPELPPAAEQDDPGGRHWWQRRRDGEGRAVERDVPRHVRVLSADDPMPSVDPWEAGFDEPHEAEADEEDPGEAVIVEEREQGRSRPS